MSLRSLASVVGIGGDPNPVTAAIGIYNEGYFGSYLKNIQEDSKYINGKEVSFQYFPERITDSRSAVYAQKQIPGGSHPLYTFISGGERVISFDAIFCNDSSDKAPSGGILSAVASSLFGGGNDRIPNNDRKDVVDISAALNFLSAFTYPFYDSNDLAFPPPIAVVYLPNSGLYSSDKFKNSFTGILSSRKIVYESFHRDGTPRIVAVTLEFREVIQLGNTWKFVNGKNLIMDENIGGRFYNRNHKDGS